LGQVQQQWIREYNGPGVNKTDFANATCTDASGNVYVTGGISGYGEEIHYATIKYNDQGVMQWIAEYSDPTFFSKNPDLFRLGIFLCLSRLFLSNGWDGCIRTSFERENSELGGRH
jgi:hypothetical protein